jgi:hypothetical protein
LEYDLSNLAEQLGRCSTLDELTASSISLLGNPMVVFDRSMRVLSITDIATGNPLFEYLRAHQVPAPTVASTAEWHRTTNLMWQSTEAAVNFLHGTGYLSKVLQLNHQILGLACVVELFRPLEDSDNAALELISYPLVQLIYSANVAGVPRKSSLAYYLEYLLDGNPYNAADLERQMGGSGWERGEQLYLLCAASADDGTRFTLGGLEEFLRPSDVLLRYLTNILILVSGNPSQLRERFAVLDQSLTVLGLPCGVSQPFTDLGQLRHYYFQSYAALDIGTRVDGHPRLYRYQNYMIYDLFRQMEREKSLFSFLPPELMELIQVDEEQHLELLKTLRCYLYHHRSVQDTANALHLHRNTVVYRINKALELMGHDRGDGRFWLQLATSIQMLEYLDRGKYFS